MNDINQILMCYEKHIYRMLGHHYPVTNQKWLNREETEAAITQAFTDAGWLRTVDVSLPALTNYDKPSEELDKIIENKCHQVKDEHGLVTGNVLTQEAFSAFLGWHKREAQTTIDTAVEQAKEMLSAQGQNGTWNIDPYNHGLYNGMEYMLALLEKRDPVFREAPEKWIGWDMPEQLTPPPIEFKV